MVELFLTKSIQFSTRMASADDMDYGELYGGGRKGVAEEAANDGSDDNECAHAAFKREQAAKKASKDLIQKQFELRKNTQEVSQESIDKLFSKHSRVKAASSTSNKVKGLTLATRELYLSRVLDVLYKNYTECQEEPTLDRKDVEDCSIDIEYSIFSTTTNMTMYRNAMAKLVSNTKRLTDDKIVHEKLLMFEPRPEKLETLTDLFRNIKKKQLIKRQATTVDKAILNTDFQTARQALQAQTPVQEPSDNSSVEKKEAKVCCDNYPVCQCTTKDMEGKGRKNFKSLFGEEDSDDGEKSSENSASLNWETVKHIVEATNSSKTHGDKEESKHKTKSHKESRHRHRHEEGRKPDDDKDEWKEKHKKHRHEEERKRRNSSDRDEDRKRKKEEDAAPAEACGSEDTKVSDNNNMREVEQATERVEEVKVSGKQNGDTGKKQRLKKTEVGGLVVKLLTPAYVDRRFESRDTFKTMARNISHALVNKDETEIREYVENFLKKNEEITSQTTI
ncbi:hypothetical protein NQ315_000321 [Exocentrus adspersus]|uniref:Set2 Rpb1 interacting domain-containing protein n=1 Tax=Exocentrus adspersus TaxID=1586481 RepID=A0AAV8VSI4_9CUCU|nr:hypothetical protein NQ315_000321 [Exocentrus adspersus]